MDYFEISDFNLSSKVDENLTVKDYELKNSVGNFFHIFSEGRNLGVLMNKKRFSIFCGIILFIWFVIFAKIFYLQIIKGNYYRYLAEGNRVRIERIEPRRGIIYDKDLIPLVKNTTSFSLSILPADLPKDQEELLKTQEQINDLLGPDSKIDLSQYISKNVLENYQPRIIKESLDYNQAMNLIVFSSKTKGVSVISENKREYTQKEYVSQILGYLGVITKDQYQKLKDKDYYIDDKIGKSGLESVYEDKLRGQFGKKKIEVDSLGRESKTLAVENPVDGDSLVLSIDFELQKKIVDLLNPILQRLNLKKASVVAIDPRDGSVLALVSTPSYDNNIFSGRLSSDDYKKIIENPDNPMFFKAISGEYPPGSTFKIMMASAALEDKVVDENTSFMSTGGIRYGQWFFPDWKAGGHGLTNVKKAIANSVNTFFYTVGGGYNDSKSLGLDRINFYGKLFGFTQKTGIDLPNEASGFLPTAEWKLETKGEPWYIGDTYHLSIGQGDALVTPLQIAMMTSVVANGGKLYQPRVVDKIIDGEFATRSDVVVKNSNFISDKNIKIVQEGMRMAVTDGSCRGLSTLPFESAGKTGTAQFDNSQTHAWFTGYAPYDSPNIALTILIEGGGEGSAVAVPLARDILMWYFNDRINK